MRHYLMIALATAFLWVFPHPLQANMASDGYSVSEVIAAYETGQFRVIQTRSVWLHSSPDGSHVAASFDGVYRVSDGMFFPQYDNAIFSPDSLYVAQGKDALYRLSDGHKLFDIWELPRFSPNGEYAAVDGFGVFRVRDGHKLFDIDNSDAYTDDGYMYSFFSHFSPYGNYVVIDKDGVYRLRDRRKLFDIASEGFLVSFSRDEQYVGSAGDGVYRLSDGQKLLETPGYASFSPDGNYIISDNALYRSETGEKLFDIAGNMWSISPDDAYIAVAADGVYNIETGERLFSISADAVFSPNGLYVAVSRDGIYRLSDSQKHFDIVGQSPEFSTDSAYLITRGRLLGDIDDVGGVYRVRDGYQLFASPFGATLSQDGLYAAVDTDGLYRLSDAQRLFQIEEVNTIFTADDTYIIASSADNDSVYRVRDGYRYRGLRLLNIPAGIMAVGNSILVVDSTQQHPPLSFVRTQPYANRLYDQPFKEAEPLGHINGGTYMAILKEQGKWYEVSNNGHTGWVPADGVRVYYLPE